MNKKFAICFSGYPRFVSTTFNNIKDNFLSGLNDFDIYANFLWDENCINKQIHHEFNDTFQANELEDFKKLYAQFNLKQIVAKPSFIFDTSYYTKTSLEPDMPVTIDAARDILYRMKSQYQGIYDCAMLAHSQGPYQYYIRMRTDNIFHKKIDINNLNTEKIICQDGYVAGADREFSDWFFIVPAKHIQFYSDLAKVEEHHKDGIVHMHKLMDRLGKPYSMKSFAFEVGIPSTSQFLGQLLKSRK